jgi:hypothetical protein
MGRPKGSVNKKSIWLMESLAEHGYDYEKMLTKFLLKAAQGDQVAYGMAQLLVKMVPYLANMPKTDQGTLQIETLVINRFDEVKQSPPLPSPVDTIIIDDMKPTHGVATPFVEDEKNA